MKILFICHRFPYPPNEGGKIRSFNMIAHLQQQHDVTVASLSDEPIKSEDINGMLENASECVVEKIFKPFAWLKAIMCLLTTIPSSMGYFNSMWLKRRVAKLVDENNYDLIIVHCSSVAQLVSSIKGIPKVLDYCDMDSQKWLTYVAHKSFPMNVVYWLEGVKLARAEKKLASQFNAASVATEAELESLRQLNSEVQSFKFPNGVDTDYFAPSDIEYNPKKICFIGKMNYYPNEKCMLEFCENIFPKLQKKYPDIQLSIVGSNPTPNIKKLAFLDGVEVTGRVDDVRPYVQSAALTVVPLEIARGTQNKILESLAMGVPVICSRLAAKGVDAVPGEHLLVADTADEYLRCVGEVIEDVEFRKQLALSGHARMLEHHTWQTAMREMDINIKQCLDQMPHAASFELTNKPIETN